MIKGIIFDFDGTLYDSLYVWDNVAVDYLKSIGGTPESDLAMQFRNMDLRQAANYYIDHYHVKLTQEEIMQGINDMVENEYANNVCPKEGVPELLEKLRDKGIKLCIATATDKYLIEKALERCGLEKYFIDIFSCTDVKKSKQEPDIYRLALKCLGTDKSETAVFEDNLNALTTAKRDGFKAVGVKDNHSNLDELEKMSDVYIDSYNEIDELLKFIDE